MNQSFKVSESFFSGIEFAIRAYRQCGHVHEFPGMDKKYRIFCVPEQREKNGRGQP
jgi:hypothetical protein